MNLKKKRRVVKRGKKRGRKIEVGVRGVENFMDSRVLVFYKV